MATRAPYYLRDPFMDNADEGLDPVEVLLRAGGATSPDDPEPSGSDNEDPIVSGRVKPRDPILDEDTSHDKSAVVPSGGSVRQPATTYPMPDTSHRDDLRRKRDELLGATPWPIPLMNQNRDRKLAQVSQALSEEDRFANQDYGHRIQAFNATKPKVVGQPWFDPDGNMHYTVQDPTSGELRDQNMGAGYNRYADANATKLGVAGTNAGARIGAATIHGTTARDVAGIRGDTSRDVAGIRGNTAVTVQGMRGDTATTIAGMPARTSGRALNDPMVALRDRALADQLRALNQQLRAAPDDATKQDLQMQISKIQRQRNQLNGTYAPATISGPPPAAMAAPAAPAGVRGQVTPPPPAAPPPVNMGGRKAKDNASGVIFYEQPDGRWLDPQGNEYGSN